MLLFCFLLRGLWLGIDKAYSLGGLESIMEVIGEVEVRIIEGNCVGRHKAWREVKTVKRSRRCLARK